MNSAGYSEIEQPIRAREKHYPLFVCFVFFVFFSKTSNLSAENFKKLVTPEPTMVK